MIGDRDQSVERLFHQAVELTPSARAAFLDAECDDPAVRREVETLLAHEPVVPGEFLNELPPTYGGDENESDATGPTIALPSGAMVDDVLPGHSGRYRIVAKLGEGGFGVVYEADQEAPLRRRVALKIIKAGMDTKQVIARFEAERHALALMDHPNIARVLDAGATASGRPYFVMELVRGVPITVYCDRENLSLRQRLELFLEVCHAVEHAHQKGIIHRDLKPSNILVARGDEKGLRTEDSGLSKDRTAKASHSVLSTQHSVLSSAQPKIIDFGIAKATAGRLTDMTLFTELHQLIGTPQYMSPEQAEVSGVDIDTRSDIYALGVLLYELLVGSTPLEGRRLRSAPLAEIQRLICEEEPPKPSTRLSSLREGAKESRDQRTEGMVDTTSPRSLGPSLPGSLSNVAARRRTDPQSLLKQLRGDLDWIVMKCLEKERDPAVRDGQRLAEDIVRYLDCQPVLASPASAGYRLRKVVRRNRGAVIAGVVVASALLIATGLSLAFGLSEARQRQAAESALTRAEKAEGEAKARADELEQVATFQEGQLSGIDPQTMGVRFRTGLLEKARAAAERSKLPPEQVNARIGELEALIAGGDFTGLAMEALEENFFRPALEAIDKQFSDQPLVKARLLNALGSTLRNLGLLETARRPQEEALQIRRSALGKEHAHTLASLNNMGLLLHAQGKFAEAEPFLVEALETRRRVLGEEHPETITSLNNMGFLLDAQGKLPEAERYYREALEKHRRVKGDEHPETLTSINNLGFLLQAQGNLSEAERYYREGLETSRRVLGDEHADTVLSINNICVLLQVQGRLSEAEPYCREALEKFRRVRGDEHPDALRALNNMGVLLRIQGKPAEAEPFCREALEKFRRILGDEHTDTLTMTNNMGLVLHAQDKLAEAEPYCREAMEKRRRVRGEEDPDTLVSIGSLGGVLVAQGKSTEAIQLLAAAEAAARREFTGGNAVRLGRFLTVLGRARAATGEFDSAESNLNEAHAVLGEARGATEQNRTDVLLGLVELYDAWHAAAPGNGYDANADEWRGKLAEWKSSTQPAGK